MKELPKVSKIFLFITMLTGTLWAGAYLVRMFICYQLFEDDLSLKNYITQENLSGILFTILPAVTTTFILYIAFIISFVIFLFTSKLSLKKNGWLFITTLIIFVTFPFEAYLMTIDFKLIILLNKGSFDAANILSLVLERLKALSSFPLVEIFCYFSIYFFILFKPLTAKEKIIS